MIEHFRTLFIVKDNILYWKEGTKKAGKQAGHIRKDGRIEVNVGYKGKRYKFFSYVIIFAIHYNYFPELIDHIYRDPTNNNINNLRDANKKINAINTGIPINNTSGCKGVSWNKACNKWSAQIKIDGKKKHLGTFKTFEDARKARETAERIFWDDLR